MLWQLQDAKQRFSQLVRLAVSEGPQTVTRHGQAVAVVVSAEEYERLTKPKLSFKEYLRSLPDMSELDLTRQKDYPREIEL
jgi:prevent-host-death family protein